MASSVDKHPTITFFGRVSWGNAIDWLVTLCAGAIIMLTAVKLGGVRPDTQVALLPLYSLLLVLHGLWLAIDCDSPKRLSHIPAWFLPALLWILCSVLWLSPVKWLGWHEMIYATQAFIMLWVLSNNLRTRAHLWVLIIMSLAPASIAVFNGFYQSFQEPSSIVDAMTHYPLALSAQFLGRATGIFADPNSLAAFILILLPLLLIAAAVKRLPAMLRIFCFYIAVMLMVVGSLTQAFWAAIIAVILLAIVPWFCFRRFKTKMLYSSLGGVGSILVFVALSLFYPALKEDLKQASSAEGVGVRIVLWKEALSMVASSPITGVGAGAYAVSFQQSPRVSLADSPSTPHNDYLLVLSQLGLFGALLFAIPSLCVFFKSLKTLNNESYAVKLRDSGGTTMPPRRFFLALGLSGLIAFGLCMLMTFVFYVPALTLYGVVMFAILIKISFNRRLKISEHGLLRLAYFFLLAGFAWSFYVFSSHKLQASALELRARQQLDHLVEMQVHVSGNAKLLDDIIVLFQDALVADDQNVDAWIGLSSAICQKYFRDPAIFEQFGARAVDCATRAVKLSPEYWMTWAQLGVANSFYGEAEAAEVALAKAVELAPNSSNGHYYYAAFLGADGRRRAEALSSVRKALEINPQNSAARRLEQKLLIF